MSIKKAGKKEKEVLEKYLIQFLNIEKKYPLLPGIGNIESVAGLMGLDEGELVRLREGYSYNAHEAAVELLKDDTVSEQIDNLPFKAGETIAALGDSLTDDLQGWFSIFSDTIDMALPDQEFSFINSGVSYNTTSEALRRLNSDLLSRSPDWVIIALGTFDAIRPAISPGRTLLPLSETWENLDTIKNAVAEVTDNPPVWITPPPVISSMMEAHELFDFTVEESDLDQIRQLIAGKAGYIVDPLGRRMGHPAEAWYYLNDGLHPSLSGHLNTVQELFKSLTQQDPESREEVSGD